MDKQTLEAVAVVIFSIGSVVIGFPISMLLMAWIVYGGIPYWWKWGPIWHAAVAGIIILCVSAITYTASQKR
jgi:hypothetical protein